MSGGTGVAVHARAVSKTYGSATALKDLDLDLTPGEFTVLLGPSGSGKSTLARCLAGVERISDGSLHLGDLLVDDGRRQSPPEKRDLAMVFQDYALWPHLTVEQNVAYPLRRSKVAGAQRTERATQALESVGLAEFAGRYPSQLSGGQQQRVALARAIVGRPSLLIFDEPLSNLDADLRERLRVQISTLTRDCGATALYITHDQSEAFALADRIGVMNAGRIVQFERPEDVYQRPATPFVARFTGISSELGGVVRRTNGDKVDIDLAGQTIEGTAMEPIRAGEKCVVLLRPSASTLREPSASNGSTGNALRGQVKDSAFRGRGYEHAVHTPVGEITGVHSGSPTARGTEVDVVLDPAGVLAYRTEPTTE